jgi:HEAT repeat protein
MRLAVILFIACAATAAGQTAKEVRASAKQGASALPKLQSYLKNPDNKVREEAVKGIIDIGTSASVNILIEATRDNDENIQIRATDGLVNFYLPGYVPSGMTAPIKRASTSIRARFGDRNDQTIEPYVIVQPEVIRAIGALVRGGVGPDSRANAARAIGILRGRAAEPDLYAALKSKDSEVLFETVIALQKIRDEAAGPHVQYLLRDLSEKVQLVAIETSGILQNHAALPDLRSVLQTSNKSKVRKAALNAIAMLPDPANRPIYTQYFSDSDDSLRASAAEGFGRLRDPADMKMLQQAWQDEIKRNAQISLAFALVMCGQTQINDNSPLRYLVQSLDLSSARSLASPLLTEAARNAEIRLQLYGPLEQGTKEQKIAIAQILSVDGDRATESHLEKTSHDPDPQVAEEGLRALRNLRTRL